MGIWSSTQEYVNSDLFIDTIFFNGCSYYCKKSGYNHQPTDNADNEYWGLMCARGSNASVTIVDDLITNNTSYVLSANQGRILKELIDGHTATLNSINANIQSLTTRIQNLETKVANMLDGTQEFTKVNAQNISASGQVDLAGTTNIAGSLVI